MKRNLLTNLDKPRPAETKVGANRLGWMRILMGVVFVGLGMIANAQINMTVTSSSTQDFNSLLSSGSGSWTDNSTISNWYSQRTGTGTTIVADAGTNTGGNLYSYGTGTNSDRALGSLGSGNAAAGSFAHGVLLRNTSGVTITNITVSYSLEQWRNSAAAAQSITFYYKTSNSAITSLTPNNSTGWTQVAALSLTSPITGGTAGALDGNNSANRISLVNVAIPSLSLANNDYIMLKWEDPNHSGTDHGLSIDDVVISWTVTSSSPTITVNPTTLTGLNYVQGSGPSANQTFTCSGTNLTNDILLTAPTNYEISENAGGPFGTDITLTQTSGSVALTTIYVRLMAGLPAGNYNSETVTATSTGATSKTVTLSGTVSGPIITITPTTLSGLEYDYGAGPSNFDDFAVSGTSLTADILLTAPSNYEIATASGGPYGSTLTLTQSGGVVNSTTIYVRLKAGLAVGNYNQNVTATSTGAVSKTVYVMGEVKSTPCLLEGFNAGTTAPAGWTFTGIGGTYTTSGNYGVASPSLKIDDSGDQIITSVIGGATELSFWIKGQSTNTTSALLVEGYNGSWSTVENIVPLPTTGTIKTYNSSSTPALAAGFTQFRFTYTKSAGNLAFDDVTAICTSVPNTITTGTVSTPPFAVTCSTGATGTVAFTSTDLFSSNTYTAQLSNASGSFASPVNIGSLLTDANSGTITFTIPPGTPTGSGYMIRVISSNPVVIGSNSATFSVTLSGGPCSCYEIESILVDACDEGVEGENEMFRFTVGGGDLNTSDIFIDWPNNPWKGVCQNAATDSIVAGINATVTSPGQVVQPVGGVIPAGATVMFFTSTAFDYSKFDFSALNYTLYAVFQCEGNTQGHFGNHTSTGDKTLVLECGSGCHSETVTYNADSLYAGDGATVDFDVPGTPTYSDSGYCASVPIFDVLPVELIYFKSICDGNSAVLYWSTATETNNAYFTIEAADAANADFVPVAKVDGAGNSNEMLNYSIEVETSAKYFRLKQTDYDGKFTYSDVIAVDCEHSSVQLFPTLVAEGENITIIGEVSSIRVFDSMGREVFPEINENKVCCLEPGMYFFVINGKSNHKVVVQ